MRGYTGPGEVRVAPQETLVTALWEMERSSPERPAVAFRQGGRFVTWRTARFVAEVRAVAKGLIGIGVEHGDRVCVMSETRLEWTVLDYAIWAVGAVTVPIYETSSPDQIAWIVSDSQARVLVVASAEMREEFDSVADQLDSCEHVFVLDDGGLDQLKAVGAEVADEELEARASGVEGEDISTIVYTSGTTGRPKGCVLTHHNFVWTVEQTRSRLATILKPGKTTLLFLPLAHIFSRVIQVTCLRTGVVLAFSSGLDQLREELALFRPTFLLAVPRVFEKVYTGAQQKAHDERKGAIFDHAASIAERWSRERQDGSHRWSTRLQHALFDRLVYRKLRKGLGGRVEFAISGGAALGERIGHFFTGAGVPVLEGYGLTETTAPVAVNSPELHRIGTVGPPLPGVSVRIGERGQILVRGGNVFQGYLGNDEATAEVLDDEGWFDTEDLGELDDEGFLRITGRSKEIIVTAGGKNVAPAVLEDRMRAHRLVSQSMVVGDKQPFIGALIAVDLEELPRWAEEHGKPSAEIGELIDDEELRAELQGAVDEANRAVSRAEQIREFRVLPEDLSVEGGELTPTMKVKREVVEERHRDLIDDIYADVGGRR